MLNVETICLLVKRDNFRRYHTLLALLILNGKVKTKLAILPILCCEEIVKNSITCFDLCVNNVKNSIIRGVGSPAVYRFKF